MADLVEGANRETELKHQRAINNWAILTQHLRHKHLLDILPALKAQAGEDDADATASPGGDAPPLPKRRRRRNRRLAYVERLMKRQAEADAQLKQLRDLIEEERRRNLEKVLAAVCLLVSPADNGADFSEDGQGDQLNSDGESDGASAVPTAIPFLPSASSASVADGARPRTARSAASHTRQFGLFSPTTAVRLTPSASYRPRSAVLHGQGVHSTSASPNGSRTGSYSARGIGSFRTRSAAAGLQSPNSPLLASPPPHAGLLPAGAEDGPVYTPIGHPAHPALLLAPSSSASTLAVAAAGGGGTRATPLHLAIARGGTSTVAASPHRLAYSARIRPSTVASTSSSSSPHTESFAFRPVSAQADISEQPTLGSSSSRSLRTNSRRPMSAQMRPRAPASNLIMHNQNNNTATSNQPHADKSRGDVVETDYDEDITGHDTLASYHPMMNAISTSPLPTGAPSEAGSSLHSASPPHLPTPHSSSHQPISRYYNTNILHRPVTPPSSS